MNPLLAFQLRRVGRNRQYLIFTVVLPALFTIFFTKIFGGQAAGAGAVPGSRRQLHGLDDGLRRPRRRPGRDHPDLVRPRVGLAAAAAHHAGAADPGVRRRRRRRCAADAAQPGRRRARRPVRQRRAAGPRARGSRWSACCGPARSPSSRSACCIGLRPRREGGRRRDRASSASSSRRSAACGRRSRCSPTRCGRWPTPCRRTGTPSWAATSPPGGAPSGTAVLVLAGFTAAFAVLAVVVARRRPLYAVAG